MWAQPSISHDHRSSYTNHYTLACEIRAGDTVEVKALPLRWATHGTCWLQKQSVGSKIPGKKHQAKI